jgi:hypothetical protein
MTRVKRKVYRINTGSGASWSPAGNFVHGLREEKE